MVYQLELPKRTENTIIDCGELDAELERIRGQRYDIDNEGWLAAFATPLCC